MAKDKKSTENEEIKETIFEQLDKALKANDIPAAVKCFDINNKATVSREFVLKLIDIAKDYIITDNTITVKGSKHELTLKNKKINPVFVMKI